jgi:hypothetical protein
LNENERIYRIIKESKFIEQINILEDKILKVEKESDLEKYFGAPGKARRFQRV